MDFRCLDRAMDSPEIHTKGFSASSQGWMRRITRWLGIVTQMYIWQSRLDATSHSLAFHANTMPQFMLAQLEHDLYTNKQRNARGKQEHDS